MTKKKDTTKIVKLKVNAWDIIDENALWDMVWDKAIKVDRVPTSPIYTIKGVKNEVLDIEVEVEMTDA